MPKQGNQRIIKYCNIFFNALESGNYKIPNNEALSFYLCCLTDSLIKNDVEKYFPLSAFFELSTLFIRTLFDLYQGNNFATNFNFLNNFIYLYYRDTNSQGNCSFINNYIAKECLNILLPNFSSLNIDDIMEIKTKANDELLELRSYINDFSANSSKYSIGTTDFSILTQNIQLKLNQSVEAFKRKCENMKYDIAQKIITEIKNPLSYYPLLVSLFQNIPVHIELLVSLSLISSNSILEYFKKSNELKNDPLYFTYKISKYF